MRKVFIKDLAEARAQKIFTKEYYLHVTDSWYFDELFDFEQKIKDTLHISPRKREKEYYMEVMSHLFNKYKDKFYSGPLAQDCYSQCIDCFDKLLKTIEYGNTHFSEFTVDDELIKQVKDLGNIFVNKHNSFCKDKDDK